MNNHPAYHWLQKIVKALVASWRSLSNIYQFSLQSHEARLTVGKAKILDVRLTKRLSKYLKIQMRHTHRFTYDLSSWSSHEVHQANEKVLRTSNKNYIKNIKFLFYILHHRHYNMQTQYFFERQSISQLLIFSAGVDKIIKSFNRSQTSSSSTTWVYAQLQVSEHRLGGYSHRERWSRTR
jgi:hypothetical protein